MKKQLTHYFPEYGLKRIVCTYITGRQFETPQKQVIAFSALFDWLNGKGEIQYKYTSLIEWLGATRKELIETILENYLNEVK